MTHALQYGDVVMGDGYLNMLPFRGKYHFYFIFSNVLPQNPLEKFYISDFKAFFSSEWGVFFFTKVQKQMA